MASFSLSDPKFWSMLQSIVTIAAVVVGGAWTYLLFVRRREPRAHAEVTHALACWRVEKGARLLSLDVFVANSGKVLLQAPSLEVRLLQMLPPDGEMAQWLRMLEQGAAPHEFAPLITQWRQLASYKDDQPVWIEPGERQQYHFDFLVAAEPTLVIFESFIPNRQTGERRLGWSQVTVHEIPNCHESGE